jgi:uncharacterized protein YecE (DUF72 family)
MVVTNGKNILVGAGGWYQYQMEEFLRETRLRAYSREFDFVELNQTFYSLVHPRNLEYYRKIVPQGFEFSVKCYRGLTHEIGLRAAEDAFRLFSMMQEYCKVLDSKILLLQMPPSLKLDGKFVKHATDFLKSISFGGLRLACEFRVTTDRVPASLVSMMRDFNISHVVDLSFEDPRIETDLLYTRVFGKPAKNNVLDSSDVNKIKSKVQKTRSNIVRVVGHSLKMIDDTRKIKASLNV